MFGEGARVLAPEAVCEWMRVCVRECVLVCCVQEWHSLASVAIHSNFTGILILYLLASILFSLLLWLYFSDPTPLFSVGSAWFLRMPVTRHVWLFGRCLLWSGLFLRFTFTVVSFHFPLSGFYIKMQWFITNKMVWTVDHEMLSFSSPCFLTAVYGSVLSWSIVPCSGWCWYCMFLFYPSNNFTHLGANLTFQDVTLSVNEHNKSREILTTS